MNFDYPYTDMHELNLDWFLAKFKEYYEHITEQDQKITTLEETVEQFTTFVSNYFDNLDVQEEINNKLDEMYENGELTALIQPLFDTFSASLNNRINSLESRMDTFSSLTEGSTTGDAELMDIRVGYDGTVYPTAGDAVRMQDAALENALHAKFGFSNENNLSLINRDDIYSNSGNLAMTRRWFINKKFKAGSLIKGINFAVSQDSAHSKNVYVEIWDLNAGTLSRVFQQNLDVTPDASVPGTVKTYNVFCNYTVIHEAMICFLTQDQGCIPYIIDPDGADTMLVCTDIDPTTNSITLTDVVTFGTKVIPSLTVTYIETIKSNVVTIGPGQDYEEIQNALIAISDDSAINPYTFIILPKKEPYKPFSMIRNSFDDNYPWSNITPRWISLIGLNKEMCVIKSDSGDYKYPCGEPLTNGIIKNLKFIMTNDDQTVTATQGGYCLHIDCRPAADVGYNMTIEDCDFEDESGPCLGIGIHQDCNLVIRRCRFNTTLDPDYNPHAGYTNLYNYGCIFCHTSTIAGATGQHLTIEDCIGKCAAGNLSLRVNATVQFNPPTAEFVYTLFRNIFWNVSQNSPSYEISASLTADPMNYGNNS